MKHAVILILYLLFNTSFSVENKIQSLLDLKQNKNIMQEKVADENKLRNELFETIKIFNEVYLKTNKEIFYTKWDGFEWYIIKDGEREYESINDSLRLSVIKNGLNNKEFKSLLTINYYNRTLSFNKSLNDPLNIGYVMTQHEIGKTMLYILSDRDDLNSFDEFINQDPSQYMSEQDYIDYHKVRIHIVNEKKAIYKNLDAEVSLENNFDIMYFILIKENDKWLLDGIKICKRDEEEAFDIKIIGEYKPIEYYEAKEYDFPE